MKRAIIVSLVAVVALGWAATVTAEPTQVTVRVISHGGGFIGKPGGGAQVTLRDADTGELLARGMTEGGPGDIERIRKGERGAVIATEDAARFTAVLELDRPRLVEVTAIGPMQSAEAANRASVTQWVVPGRDLTAGNGWLVEIPGLAVTAEAPAVQEVALAGGAAKLDVAASITLMCGCPITPGGRWDVKDYELAALVYRDGKLVDEQQLSYAGEPSRFKGAVEVDQPGSYELALFAHNPKTGNTGVDRLSFTVTGSAAMSDKVAAAMAKCSGTDGKQADITDSSGASAAIQEQ